MKRGFFALAVLGGLAAGASQAGAQIADAYAPWAASGEAMIRAGSWYAGFGARAEYQFLKTYVGPVFGNPAVNGGAQASIDARALAVGPEGTLGYVLQDGALPAWLGRNVRVELNGGWQGGRVTRTVESVFAGGAIGQYFQITGVPVNYGFAGGGTSHASLLVRTSQWQVGLTGKSDYNLTPTLLLSPFLSVFGGSARANYDFRDRSFFNGFGSTDHIRAERLDTWHVGSKLGANLVWEITHFARAHLGGHVGLAYQRASYSGLDCTGFPGLAVPNCVTGAGALLVNRINASASRIGFLGGAEIGGSYSFDWMIVSLNGSWRYNSATPGIRNPSPATPGPAGVAFTGEHTLAAQVKLIFPFR